MWRSVYGSFLVVVGLVGFIFLLAEPKEETSFNEVIALKIIGLALFGLAMVEGRQFTPHEEE